MVPEPLPPPDALIEHAAFLRALARRLVGDPDLALESEQETWLTALRRGPRDPSRAKTWLARVLRRRVGRAARTEARRGRRERAAARDEAQPGPDETLARAELLRRVTAAVLELEEPLRSTLIARYYEGLEPVEIARRSGIPAGTVRTRLRRAIERLRERLDRGTGGRDAWAPALLFLTRGGRAPAGAATLAPVVGGIVMSSIPKLAAVAVVAALVVTVTLVERGLRDERQVGDSSSEIPELSQSRPEDASAESTRTAAPLDDRGSAARRALAAAEDERDLAVFRVRESDGAPAADLLAVLLDEEGERAPTRTDSEGVARFAAHAGKAELVVERRGAPPWRGSVDARAGERQVALPEGERVSGRLVVDGAPPAEALELQLIPTRVVGYPPPDTKDPIEQLLEPQPNVKLVTSLDGRFAARGLAADWSGVLSLPRGHALRGRRAQSDPWGQARLDLDAPREGLVIELERFPSVRGRLLRADGQVATEGEIQVALTGNDGTGPIVTASTDSDGSFELFVQELPAAVSLEAFELPGKSGRREFEFDREALAPDGELGDLRLAPFRPPLGLRVVDPDGRPIERARAKESGFTDAEGRVVVSGLAPEQRELVLVARGYRNRTVELPEPPPHELEVVLEPTTVLRIQLMDEQGRPLRDELLDLRAATCPFVHGRTLPYVITRGDHEGRMVTASTGREGGYRGTGRTGDDGILELWDLRTQLPLTVVVPAPVGAPLVEAQVELLAEREQRALPLTVPERLALRGRVLDEHGAPLAGAQVRILHDEVEPRLGASARATEDGRFELRRLSEGEYTLEATRPGYLPARTERVRAGGEPVDIRLARGLDLRVVVEDELGRPVPGGRLALAPGQIGMGKYPSADGLFELEGLAPEPLDLELHVGGGIHRQRWTPGEEVVRFVLPVHGAVELAWGAWPESWPRSVDLALIPADGERESLESSLYDPPPGSERLPAVLPGEWTLAVIDDSTEEPRDLTPRVAVRVEAGATTRVQITP